MIGVVVDGGNDDEADGVVSDGEEQQEVDRWVAHWEDLPTSGGHTRVTCALPSERAREEARAAA